MWDGRGAVALILILAFLIGSVFFPNSVIRLVRSINEAALSYTLKERGIIPPSPIPLVSDPTPMPLR